MDHLGRMNNMNHMAQPELFTMSGMELKTLWVNTLLVSQILGLVFASMVQRGPLGCHLAIRLSAGADLWSGCRDSGQVQVEEGRTGGIWEGWLGLTFSWNTVYLSGSCQVKSRKLS